MDSQQQKSPKQYWRKRYLQRISEHRCTRCGAIDDMTLQGRVKCAECSAKANARKYKPLSEEKRAEKNANKREWKKRQKAAHVCLRCGEKDARTLDGMNYCLPCSRHIAAVVKKSYDSEHKNALRNARRESWRAEGLCSRCGGKKEEPDKAMCIDCRVKTRMDHRRQRIKQGIVPRGTGGMCCRCNRVPAIEGKKLCQSCYDKQVVIARNMTIVREERRRNEKANATGSDRGHPCEVP